ncbi:hypothetical protein AMTRI_Chr03g145890 [Amborella trichopoda]
MLQVFNVRFLFTVIAECFRDMFHEMATPILLEYRSYPWPGVKDFPVRKNWCKLAPIQQLKWLHIELQHWLLFGGYLEHYPAISQYLVLYAEILPFNWRHQTSNEPPSLSKIYPEGMYCNKYNLPLI